jgi:hypothetical protein
MHWEVHIPGDEVGAQSWAVTVDAENWFSALRMALTRRGLDGSLVSNLTCDIKPDRSVHVTDFVTRKVFVLRVVEHPGSAPAAPAPAPPGPAPTPETGPDPAMDSGLPADLPPHEAFFWRDEAPTDGSGIFCRERLLAVDSGVSVEDAGRLALAVFERLRALGAAEGTKLFVTVQVFDHAFEQRSLRPPIAALAWKEWSPKKAKIEFPLSGAASIGITHVPRSSYPPVGAPPAATLPPPALAAPVEPPPPAVVVAPAPVYERPVDLVPRPVAPAPAVVAPVPVYERPVDLVPRPATPPVEKKPRARHTPGPMSPIPASDTGIEDKVVHAFERMHDLYSIREHDAAASFALDLGREFVDCEAGSAMLITPGKYELYIAAAAGPVADRLLGRKMSLTKGIIGFATRAGAVVTVSDPASDPRFHEEFDAQSGFVTRNVACAPIQHEGRTIGAIELINSPRPTGFLQTEANVLSYIAGALGEYIDTSLPSREADFSDKEFAEFMPPRRAGAAPGAGKPVAARPAQGARPDQATRPAPAKPAPAKPAPAKPAPANPPAPAPAADKKTAAGSASKGKKKRKR